MDLLGVPADHRSGFVNIIGRPNVGKSTLLNELVGEKMSIITSKPQTTRHRILAILNTKKLQIVFSDTPGIVVNPAYKMHESMNHFVRGTFEDADVMLLLVTPGEEYDERTPYLNKLGDFEAPTFLVINKQDVASEEVMQATEAHWSAKFSFEKVFHISALKGIGTQELLESIAEKMPTGPAYFPKDQLTDRPARFFVTEIIRQHILNLYDQEVPYSAEVAVEYFNEKVPTKSGDLITKIGAIIFVNRQTQKMIIIGKGGSKIKKLGTEARKDIERFLDCKIFLELHVKVKEGWRDDEKSLNRFGYQ